MSLILIMNGHMFQAVSEHKGVGLDQPVLTQYPISVSKCVSNPYLGNLDNSVMENKQGETCFYFLDDLCAKWGIKRS